MVFWVCGVGGDGFGLENIESKPGGNRTGTEFWDVDTVVVVGAGAGAVTAGSDAVGTDAAGSGAGAAPTGLDGALHASVADAVAVSQE